MERAIAKALYASDAEEQVGKIVAVYVTASQLRLVVRSKQHYLNIRTVDEGNNTFDTDLNRKLGGKVSPTENADIYEKYRKYLKEYGL